MKEPEEIAKEVLMSGKVTDLEKRIIKAIAAERKVLEEKGEEIERLKNLTHFGYSEVPELQAKIKAQAQVIERMKKVVVIAGRFIEGYATLSALVAALAELEAIPAQSAEGEKPKEAR